MPRRTQHPCLNLVLDLVPALVLAPLIVGIGGCDDQQQQAPVQIPGKLYKADDGRLEGVTLRERQVTRDDLQAIVQGGSRDLKSLNLIRCRISRGSLAVLSGLEQLDYLDLRASSITDSDLEDIGRLKTLTVLDLYDTRITDAGVEHLKGLTNLKSLGLYKTDITGAALAHVSDMKQLNLISVTETRLDLVPCRTRIPFRFGIHTLTEAPLATATVMVENEQGRTACGASSGTSGVRRCITTFA